jgi:hypothetical protein
MIHSSNKIKIDLHLKPLPVNYFALYIAVIVIFCIILIIMVFLVATTGSAFASMAKTGSTINYNYQLAAFSSYEKADSSVGFWQGIKTFTDKTTNSNIQIRCGTARIASGAGVESTNNSYENSGVMFIQGLGNNSAGKSIDGYYYINYPNTNVVSTSLYGPNYIPASGTKDAIYQFVGCYSVSGVKGNNGFYFSGTLADIINNNSKCFFPILTPAKQLYTFGHSMMGNCLIYNANKKKRIFRIISSLAKAYIYNTKTNSSVQIKYPKSITTTAYGLWYVGGSKYIIVGGFSTNIPYEFEQIGDYINSNGETGYIRLVAAGYVVTYDLSKNTFSNWSQITYPASISGGQIKESNVFLTHIQGISQLPNNKNIYSLAVTSIAKQNVINSMCFVKLVNGVYSIIKWMDISNMNILQNAQATFQISSRFDNIQNLHPVVTSISGTTITGNIINMNDKKITTMDLIGAEGDMVFLNIKGDKSYPFTLKISNSAPESKFDWANFDPSKIQANIQDKIDEIKSKLPSLPSLPSMNPLPSLNPLTL